MKAVQRKLAVHEANLTCIHILLDQIRYHLLLYRGTGRTLVIRELGNHHRCVCTPHAPVAIGRHLQCGRRSSGQQILDLFLEGGEGLGPGERYAINPECRCPGDALCHALLIVSRHFVSIDAFIQTGIKLGLIQPQVACQLFERVFRIRLARPLSLVFKERIVHFPELGLLASTFCCLSGFLSLRMDGEQGKIPEYVLNLARLDIGL